MNNTEEPTTPTVLEALISLVHVARRYLPDYDEHPEIQKADDAIEAAQAAQNEALVGMVILNNDALLSSLHLIDTLLHSSIFLPAHSEIQSVRDKIEATMVSAPQPFNVVPDDKTWQQIQYEITSHGYPCSKDEAEARADSWNSCCGAMRREILWARGKIRATISPISTLPIKEVQHETPCSNANR
jgi:hypothetical protein